MWTLVHWAGKAQFRRCLSHVPNLTDELRTAKEWHLNQFGVANALSSAESVKLLSNLTYARHMVRHLNQMLHHCRSKVKLIQTIRFGT